VLPNGGDGPQSSGPSDMDSITSSRWSQDLRADYVSVAEAIRPVICHSGQRGEATTSSSSL
jgi:hypothetical protein